MTRPTRAEARPQAAPEAQEHQFHTEPGISQEIEVLKTDTNLTVEEKKNRLDQMVTEFRKIRLEGNVDKLTQLLTQLEQTVEQCKTNNADPRFLDEVELAMRRVIGLKKNVEALAGEPANDTPAGPAAAEARDAAHPEAGHEAGGHGAGGHGGGHGSERAGRVRPSPLDLKENKWKEVSDKKAVIDISSFDLEKVISAQACAEAYVEIAKGDSSTAQLKIKNLFDVIEPERPEDGEKFVAELRNEGYSLEEFRALWKEKLWSKIYETLQQVVSQDVGQAVEENIGFMDKVKVSGTRVIKQSLVSALVIGSATTAGVLLAGWAGAGAAVSAAVGGAAGGVVRRTLKSWWNWGRDKQKNFGKEQEEQNRRDLEERKKAEVLEAVSNLPGTVNLDMSAWIAQALRDASAQTKAKEEESVTDESQKTGLRERDDANLYLLRMKAADQLHQELTANGDVEKAQRTKLDKLVNGLNMAQSVTDTALFNRQKEYEKKDNQGKAPAKGEKSKFEKAIQKTLSGELWAESKSTGMRRLGDITTIGVGAAIGYGIATESQTVRAALLGTSGMIAGMEIGAHRDAKAVQEGFKKKIENTIEETRELLKEVMAEAKDVHGDEAKAELIEKIRELDAALQSGVFSKDKKMEAKVRNFIHEGRRVYLLADLESEQKEKDLLIKEHEKRLIKKPLGWRKWAGAVGGAAIGVLAGLAGHEAASWLRAQRSGGLGSTVDDAQADLNRAAMGEAPGPGEELRVSEEESAPMSRRMIEENLPEPPPEIASEVPKFDIQDFAAQNKLNPQTAAYLQRLANEYPALNNAESMTRLIQAGQRGESVFGNIRPDKQVMLDVVEEADIVKFEEILKGPDGIAQATQYLENRGFNALDHKFLGTKDLSQFVTDYKTRVLDVRTADNIGDAKMIKSLGRAFEHDEMRDSYNWTSEKGGKLYGDGRRVSLGKDAIMLGMDETKGGNPKALVADNVKEKIYYKLPKAEAAPTKPIETSRTNAQILAEQIKAGNKLPNVSHGVGPDANGDGQPDVQVTVKSNAAPSIIMDKSLEAEIGQYGGRTAGIIDAEPIFNGSLLYVKLPNGNSAVVSPEFDSTSNTWTLKGVEKSQLAKTAEDFLKSTSGKEAVVSNIPSRVGTGGAGEGGVVVPKVTEPEMSVPKAETKPTLDQQMEAQRAKMLDATIKKVTTDADVIRAVTMDKAILSDQFGARKATTEFNSFVKHYLEARPNADVSAGSFKQELARAFREHVTQKVVVEDAGGGARVPEPQTKEPVYVMPDGEVPDQVVANAVEEEPEELPEEEPTEEHKFEDFTIKPPTKENPVVVGILSGNKRFLNVLDAEGNNVQLKIADKFKPIAKPGGTVELKLQPDRDPVAGKVIRARIDGKEQWVFEVKSPVTDSKLLYNLKDLDKGKVQPLLP